MNSETISKLVDELRSSCIGHELIRIIPSGDNEIVLHLREADPPFILVSCDPIFHRIMSVKRKTRDIEKAGTQSQFSLSANRDLSCGVISDFSITPGERVVTIALDVPDGSGSSLRRKIVGQLTGRSANIFLIDEGNRIVARMRDTSGRGQDVGDIYEPPARSSSTPREEKQEEYASLPDETFSETVDRYFISLIESRKIDAAVNAQRGNIKSELRRTKRLLESLESDLASHGDPETWKKLGDLLLANTSTARREDDVIFVIDYFDPASPEIQIGGESNKSLTQVAEEYFRKYTKARNAAEQLASRISTAREQVREIELRLESLEQSVEDGTFVPPSAVRPVIGKNQSKTHSKNGVRSPFRRFTSSDGLEILVGKGSRDNDELTFKIAKSLDTWLHAADYPGSHVVIQSAGRKEIPQRTLVEAAKLAAFYSDAKDQPKVAVHHTQRKFVGKIKGAAPGLVRLSSFKTVMVEPEIPSGVTKA